MGPNPQSGLSNWSAACPWHRFEHLLLKRGQDSAAESSNELLYSRAPTSRNCCSCLNWERNSASTLANSGLHWRASMVCVLQLRTRALHVSECATTFASSTATPALTEFKTSSCSGDHTCGAICEILRAFHRLAGMHMPLSLVLASSIANASMRHLKIVRRPQPMPRSTKSSSISLKRLPTSLNSVQLRWDC